MSDSIRNGINVNNLMAAIEAVKADPTNGRLTFTVNSKWMGGFKAEHKTSDYAVGNEAGNRAESHSIFTDEPKEVLGGDSGISPAETLLSSLASCLAVGYAANAAALGIDLDELSFEITGNGSLEGFMNIGDRRPGLGDIQVKTFVKSSASREQLEDLHSYVNQHSPIWDTICNPVNVQSKIITK